LSRCARSLKLLRHASLSATHLVFAALRTCVVPRLSCETIFERLENLFVARSILERVRIVDRLRPEELLDDGVGVLFVIGVGRLRPGELLAGQLVRPLSLFGRLRGDGPVVGRRRRIRLLAHLPDSQS
jgi:hypothetical protein